MANINLGDFSLAELKKLKKDVTKAIDGFQVRQWQEALAAVEATAKEMGYTLAELTGGSKKSKPAAAPKYAHPDNSALTWSGRGRQPAWYKEATEGGTVPEDLLIK